jgi:hypothetical protein
MPLILNAAPFLAAPGMLALIGAMGFVSGCAMQSAPSEARPDDFALSITQTESETAAIEGAAPVTSTYSPAWYVLDADGSLRGALGVRGSSTPLPPLLRHLSGEQTDRVWRELQQSGVAQRVFELPQQSEQILSGYDGSTIVYLSAGGARRTVVVAPTDPAAPGVHSVIATLRELGWVSALP